MSTLLLLTFCVTVLALVPRADGQRGGIGTPLLATPLISSLNHLQREIGRARANRCLSPPTFRWTPGHLVPPHMRAFVIEQRRARLVRVRRVSSQCGPEAAIRRVFGAYAGQALSVAWCESRFSIWARNGQYLGLFQMGSSERATYGHSWTALGQSQAAYRYFVASGSDWSPWACKP